jgi:hypothetical protein
MTPLHPLREKAVLLLMSAVVLLPILTWAGLNARSPRWRVRYSVAGSSGPVSRDFRARDVRLDNLLHLPPRALRSGARFTAEFESDLAMDEQGPVALMVTSRGPSRLFIDGRLVLGNPGLPPRQSRGETLRLSRGIHRIRLEYATIGADVYLALVGSLDGGPPRPLPASRLHRPRSGW